uniref:Uncharacterized protein n=1 Tax=Heterorhabditis bacteriophora TaxID=37862 RepID=A0A1I7W9R5_HETBA
MKSVIMLRALSRFVGRSSRGALIVQQFQLRSLYTTQKK